MIYHVAPIEHSGNLKSLYKLHGDEAYEMYATRWPDAGELALYHADYVHCYDTLAEARKHAACFGGKIYEINVEDLDVERDNLEFDHPIVQNEIDVDFIQIIE